MYGSQCSGVCVSVFACTCVQIGFQIHVDTSKVLALTVNGSFHTKDDSFKLTYHNVVISNLLGDTPVDDMVITLRISLIQTRPFD